MYDTPHPMDDWHAQTQNALFECAVQDYAAAVLNPQSAAAERKAAATLFTLRNHCGLTAIEDVRALRDLVDRRARELAAKPVEGHRVLSVQCPSCDLPIDSDGCCMASPPREPLRSLAPPAAVNELSWR